MDTNREINETLEQYALRLIKNRVAYGFEYTEIYELITGEVYSNDNSRKALYGIKAFAEKKLSSSDEKFSETMAKLSEKESIEIKSDNTQILEKFVLACEDDFKTPNDILRLLGYSTDGSWELVNSKMSKWNVSAGERPNKVLYSVKASVKPIVKKIDIEWSKEVFNELTPLPPVSKHEKNKSENMVFISLADLHYGLHGSEYETKTKQMFDEIIIEYKNADIIIVPIGNDLLHYDKISGATPTTVKGTGLEASMSYDEMFKSGLRSMCYLIDRLILETKAQIKTLYVPANHDTHSTFGLYQSIMQRYRDNDNVTFDDSMKTRKYIGVGKVGLMIAHGADEKKRIFQLFPVEAPEIYANSKCKEGLLFHLHSETVKDEGDITYRRLPTVNRADKWHEQLGFVGTPKRMQVFVYNTTKGQLKRIDQYYLDD